MSTLATLYLVTAVLSLLLGVAPESGIRQVCGAAVVLNLFIGAALAIGTL